MLYLASGSSARRWLLDQIGIPYRVIAHHADETVVLYQGNLNSYVEALAIYKMEHVDFLFHDIAKPVFILTADTVAVDSAGIIYGKPKNFEDAVDKIAALNGFSYVVTAFCIDKMVYRSVGWEREARVVKSVGAECYFEVPKALVNSYIEKTEAQTATGGIIIEGYGQQFLKEVRGSYSAIIGLPLYEVRQELYQLGFFETDV